MFTYLPPVQNERNVKMSHTACLQLLLQNHSGSSTLLYVRRDRTDYQGRGAQDGHLDFHTATELYVVCKFNVALRPHVTFTQLLSSMSSASSVLLYVHM